MNERYIHFIKTKCKYCILYFLPPSNIFMICSKTYLQDNHLTYITHTHHSLGPTHTKMPPLICFIGMFGMCMCVCVKVNDLFRNFCNLFFLSTFFNGTFIWFEKKFPFFTLFPDLICQEKNGYI